MGSFDWTWRAKYTARPNRKFFNSNRAFPLLICVYQDASLPAPFPIRIPLGLRERGKWGKTDSQNARFVLSDRRDERFKKRFSLKIFLAEIRNGRSVIRATCP